MTSTEPTPGPPANVPGWVRDYYALVDANDASGAMAWLAPEVRLRIAARPAVQGREAAGAMLRSWHALFERVSHEIVEVWQVDAERTICEFTATYAFADGGRLALPSLTIIRRPCERFTEMRIYIDEGALRARN